MKNLFKLTIMLSVFAIAVAFGSKSVQAQEETFDISVKHNINGISLGADKDLPVDVYINGDYEFTFSFGDSVETSLEAGNYEFVVKLAGTDTMVMSFGPADVPAGADVSVKAQLSGGKTPVLKVKVK